MFERRPDESAGRTVADERDRLNIVRQPLAWGLAVAAVVGAAALTLEVVCEPFRDWTRNHPVVVGITTAFLVVTPGLLGLERWIARREEKRWRGTATAGVETYLRQADRFNSRLLAILLQADREVREPNEDRGFRHALDRLAERNPDFFMRLSAVANEEAHANGHLALTAATTMALYPPLAGYVDRLWSIQERLRALDDECRAIEFLRGHEGGPKEERARAAKKRAAQRIADTHYKRQSELIELKLDLDQLSDVAAPAISEVDDEISAPDPDEDVAQAGDQPG